MKERILQTLSNLRTYALKKEYEIDLFYHEEDSYLMRFANSAISLNTNEHLIRMEITAYAGKKRASCELITGLNKIDEMKQAIDKAAEMAQHAQELSYEPTLAQYQVSFEDESAYDASLASISNEERLQYFNHAVQGLENEAMKLSGIFSCGTNIIAQINTRSEHAQYFKTSDAQVTVVLAHEKQKWEVIAEQSAQKKTDLDPTGLHKDLVFMIEHYQHDEPQQLPLGKYDIVFGPAATGDMVNYLSWIGFNGGSMKRGFSFLQEEQLGKKVLSEKFTLIDNPTCLETFPFKRDYLGIPRNPFPIFQEGVFQGFTWYQDDADEFGAKATGHTVHHQSLVLSGGDKEVRTIEELVNMPREKDVLYIPFLHYFGLVNPSKGILTASSRFGNLLLKQDGSVAIPYNVRLTQSLSDIFGDQVAWMSRETVPNNTSSSYGARNPTAIIVPKFVRVNDLEISHSNSSY